MDPDAFANLFWSLPTIERELFLARLDANEFGESHRDLGYAQAAARYHQLRAARKSSDDAMVEALRMVPGDWQDRVREYIDAPGLTTPGPYRRTLKRLLSLEKIFPPKANSRR